MKRLLNRVMLILMLFIFTVPVYALEAQFTNLARVGTNSNFVGNTVEYSVTYQLDAIPSVAVSAIGLSPSVNLNLPVTLIASNSLGAGADIPGLGSARVAVYAIDTSSLCGTGNAYILRATATVPAPNAVAETSRLVVCP